MHVIKCLTDCSGDRLRSRSRSVGERRFKYVELGLKESEPRVPGGISGQGAHDHANGVPRSGDLTSVTPNPVEEPLHAVVYLRGRRRRSFR
jgi:hypothetical protein